MPDDQAPEVLSRTDKGAYSVEDMVFQERDGLLARVYRPKGAGPFPAILEVHGGAWTINDRTANERIARDLATDGIVVASIDFRMPPDHPYPASIQDIIHGIRWLKGKAGEFTLDPAKVGILGTSSGGHQVVLVSLMPHETGYVDLPADGKPDASVAFCIAGWPICDPLSRYNSAKKNGVERLVAASEAYWQNEDNMIDGSPQHILDNGRVQAMPPILIVHGTKDGNISHTVSEAFAETYREKGGEIDLHIYEDEPHAFIREHPQEPNTLDALDKFVTFVRRHGV